MCVFLSGLRSTIKVLILSCDLFSEPKPLTRFKVLHTNSVFHIGCVRNIYYPTWSSQLLLVIVHHLCTQENSPDICMADAVGLQ